MSGNIAVKTLLLFLGGGKKRSGLGQTSAMKNNRTSSESRLAHHDLLLATKSFLIVCFTTAPWKDPLNL